MPNASRTPGPSRRSAGLRCLIVGAGEAGRAIARDLRRAPEFGLNPIGFLDDDPSAVRRAVTGVPMLGGTGELAEIAEQASIDVVIIAIPSLSAAEIRKLAVAGATAGASVRYLPTFIAALERDVRVSDLRRPARRPPARPAGGAGGQDGVAGRRGRPSRARHRGRRLHRERAVPPDRRLRARGAVPARPRRVEPAPAPAPADGRALLDSDELIIADIRDRDRIRQLFADLKPDVVFHAAAHKHLPLLERHPVRGVKSNVLGTLNLVEAAEETGVDRFIN